MANSDGCGLLGHTEVTTYIKRKRAFTPRLADGPGRATDTRPSPMS